jgi:hypothetical protein
MAKVKSDSLAIDVVFEKERLEKEGLDKDERYEEVSALAETKIEEGKEDEEDEYADDSSGGGEYSEDGDEDTSGGDDDYSEESDGEESETDDDGEPEPEEGGDEDAKAAEKGDDSDGDGKDDFGEEDSGEVNVVISESYYRRKRISLDGHAGYDRLVYPYSRFGIENQFVGYNGIAAGETV